ncbi:MAG: hypothetical protein CMI53_01290 [Parcubacteria group bacterium]|nr:hypothetical protein [Parcubacteria group bacterium]|tara:strand:- start:9158 stop:9580 length:423 start_codon:yes stop_codon:yes gene_type:complete
MSYLGTISSREYNGLKLAMQLAQTYYDQKSISLADISKSENISFKYLEQLITPFRQAGWIKAQRGRGGGYVMTKDPKTISLKEIMKMLNDEPRMLVCLEDNYKHDCPLDSDCSSQLVWKEIKSSIDNSLEKITLSKVLKK